MYYDFNRCWFFEDEFHPVQYVEESTYYEIIDEQNNVSDKITHFESEEDYSKIMKEYSRDRPYKLVTFYKDVEIKLFGTIEYLKQRKCLEYNKIITLHKNKVIADEKAELEAELEAIALDKLNNLKCN
jgi:hypothetical protein